MSLGEARENFASSCLPRKLGFRGSDFRVYAVELDCDQQASSYLSLKAVGLASGNFAR